MNQEMNDNPNLLADFKQDISVHRSFLSPTLAHKAFHLLYGQIPWQFEIRKDDGTKVKLNRGMAHAVPKELPAIPYAYDRFILETTHWTNEIYEISKLIQVEGYTPNSVLLNKYANGKDEIRWHSDREPQLGPTPTIVMVNLGATRKFHLLHKETGYKHTIPLAMGDMLIMHSQCQQRWLHAILKEKEVQTPRISLTFRHLYESVSEYQEPTQTAL